MTFAACYHQTSTIEYLLEQGANCLQGNKWDVTPIHLASAYAELEGALYTTQLLAAHGADPWKKDHGNLNAHGVIKKVCEYSSTPRGSVGSVQVNPLWTFLAQYTSVPKLKDGSKKALAKLKKKEEAAREKKREADEMQREAVRVIELLLFLFARSYRCYFSPALIEHLPTVCDITLVPA